MSGYHRLSEKEMERVGRYTKKLYQFFRKECVEDKAAGINPGHHHHVLILAATSFILNVAATLDQAYIALNALHGIDEKLHYKGNFYNSYLEIFIELLKNGSRSVKKVND